MEKTNAIRLLLQKKIPCQTYEYPHEEGICVDGLTVARLTGQNPKRVFKTLVCTSGKQYYVCVLPVEAELNLKKAAKCFGEKALEMIAVKDLLPITGYVRGGCSPIGMKKAFPTVVDDTALQFDTILFSAGKIGLQIEMNPRELPKLLKVEFKNIKREES